MKRAFLYVYLNNNFGDDLFVHLLTRRYRLTKFYVLCDKKGASTVKHHPNVHPFGEGIIFRLVNKGRHRGDVPDDRDHAPGLFHGDV